MKAIVYLLLVWPYQLKMIRNKKGQAGAALLILVLLIGTLALVVYFQHNAIQKVLIIGDKQAAILDAYTFAEGARDYIKYSGKYAGYQALYDLGVAGGYRTSRCSTSIFWSCNETINGRAVNEIMCIQKEDEDMCRAYNMFGECTSYPCSYEIDYTAECEKFEDGSIVCDEKIKGQEPETFTCMSSADQACQLRGIDDTGGFSYTTKMTCMRGEFVPECEISECGATPDEYAIWSTRSRDCIPDMAKVANSFNYIFIDRFEYMLDQYPSIPDGDAEESSLYEVTDFDIQIDITSNIKIYGKPMIYEGEFIGYDEEGNPIAVSYSEQATLAIADEIYDFEYWVDPYFEQELPVNLNNTYKTVLSEAKDSIDRIKVCGASQACADAQDGERVGFVWDASFESIANYTYVKFDLESKNINLIVMDKNNRTRVAPLPIRFAIEF